MPKNIDSLYLHFPFCMHLCNYCDFYKKVSQNFALDYQNYHKYLAESFATHHNLIESFGYSFVPLKTFYIGGGTPSLWGMEGASFIEKFFNERKLSFDADCEFTMEVNPGAWTVESMKAWRSFGANRFSLGVQSLDKQMIHYLDRVHTIDDVFETLEYFNKERLNFSMDFMLGLPFSSEHKRDVIKELELALSYNPSHFSVYILTVKDNYRHFKDLPDEEWIEKEYLLVADFLKSRGYLHYEVSNFAKKGFQSKHNLNYWKSHTVAALGPSATGFLSEEKFRYKWKANSPEMDIEHLSADEFRLEKVYMALRSEIGLKLDEADDILSERAVHWEKKGLASIVAGKVTLTSKGYLLLDSLMDELFLKKIL